jgi:glycosyltransferase involved in cell wall biosynthesis
MYELWSTILAPVLDALRPGLTVDIGNDDARVATLCAQYAQPWGGRVHSLQPLAREVAEENLRIDALGDIAEPRLPTCVDLALLHGDPNWWWVHRALLALAGVARQSGRSLPTVLVHNVGAPWGRRDHYCDPSAIPVNALHPHRECPGGWCALHEGTPRNGVLAAVEDFAAARTGLELIFLSGLGGIAILVESGVLDARARELLLDLRPSSRAAAQIELLDSQRQAERSRAERAEARAVAAEAEALDRETLTAERDQLRLLLSGHDMQGRVPLVLPVGAVAMNGAGSRGSNGVAVARLPELPRGEREDGASQPASPAPIGTPTSEPTQELVRSLLRPEALLAELEWPGAERELALAIPYDARSIVEPDAEQKISVVARLDADGLRRTLCSILERAEERVAVSILLDDAATQEVNELVSRVVYAIPGVRVVHGAGPQSAAEVLIEGDELPWRSLDLASCTKRVSAVAYLLPGLPPEGSGGSHSLVQEARGLRTLGCDARICVPSDALSVATALYGNTDELFVAYEEDADILESVGPAVVAIATEHPSLALLERLAAARPEIVCAYYVQDYEPLFGRPGSVRSDRAILSYRAIPGQVLFAKTHWLRNVVAGQHGVFVAKVSPSLDRELFHTSGRSEEDGVVRIAAMVRPRTPRRRPSATLKVLAAVHAKMGQNMRAITFGSDAEAYAEVATDIEIDAKHLGLLSRAEVGDLMRRCDIFIDASTYQAFGRTGLEAMACGVVPVLPALGGVHEYAEHGRNALIFEDDRPHAIADQVAALAGDPVRLRRLRDAGLRSAADYSIERAARSQLELFEAVARRTAAPTGVSV